MKETSGNHQAGTPSPGTGAVTDKSREQAINRRMRELSREFKRLDALKRGAKRKTGQQTAEDEAIAEARRAAEQEYHELFKENEKIYAAECLADLEKRRAELLSELDNLEKERTQVLKGCLLVRPSPEMISAGQARAGIMALERASQGGKNSWQKELEYILRDALWDLCFRALDGDKRAFRGLLRLLNSCVNFVYDIQHSQPELAKEIASRTSCWPGFLTVDPDRLRWNEKLIGLLELGRKVPINFHGKTWSRKTPEVRVALDLLSKLHTSRGYPWAEVAKVPKGLNPLCRLNYSAWWKAAEPVFAKVYGEHFEDHKEFAHYWRSDAYKEPAKTPGLKELKRNARALIRRDIKRNVKQAFRSIAPKLSAL